MIHAQISSDTIATSCGITVHVGSPVLALCRELVAQGCDPAVRLQAYRGDTLCLTIRSIGEGAKLEAGSGGVGFVRVRELRSASYSSSTAMPASAPILKPNNDVTLSSCAA